MMTTEPANKTVLIVDDEEHLRDIIAFDLRSLGLKILTAENGQEALAIAKQEPLGLVISDVRMPVMNGIQFLAHLRDVNASAPPFLFLTAFADIAAEDALAMGAEGFL